MIADTCDGSRREQSFMRIWDDVESCTAAERHAKGAAAPPTVAISKRRGGGGKGGRLAQETEVWVWPWPSSS